MIIIDALMTLHPLDWILLEFSDQPIFSFRLDPAHFPPLMIRIFPVENLDDY